MSLFDLIVTDETLELTHQDCADLLIIAAAAIKQCLAQDYHSMDFSTACGHADCLQDAFESIEETDEIMNSVLNLEEWVEFSSQVSNYYHEGLSNERMIAESNAINEAYNRLKDELAQTLLPEEMVADVAGIKARESVLGPQKLNKRQTTLMNKAQKFLGVK